MGIKFCQNDSCSSSMPSKDVSLLFLQSVSVSSCWLIGRLGLSERSNASARDRRRPARNRVCGKQIALFFCQNFGFNYVVYAFNKTQMHCSYSSNFREFWHILPRDCVFPAWKALTNSFSLQGGHCQLGLGVAFDRSPNSFLFSRTSDVSIKKLFYSQ